MAQIPPQKMAFAGEFGTLAALVQGQWSTHGEQNVKYQSRGLITPQLGCASVQNHARFP
jgi:hypothetical protein